MLNRNARFVALVSFFEEFEACTNQFFTDIYQLVVLTARIAGADLGGGVAGVATPPNDFEQPLPLIYKAYYSLAQ